MKINANFRIFAATNFDPTKYIASPAYGVNRFMLDRIGDEKARATTIVEYSPNSKFPEHTHIGGEEFLVLKGTFKDQFGEFPAGTYVRNPIDSVHAPWVDEDGCTIMVKLLQMAEGKEKDPLHIDLNKQKETDGKKTDFGTILDLYDNEFTGEHVEMCWVDPNKPFPSTEKGLKEGEELFIMEGSLLIDSEEYVQWGWLRFPVEADSNHRSKLMSGPQGAQVYRKVGHLTEDAMKKEKIQITEDWVGSRKKIEKSADFQNAQIICSKAAIFIM